MPTPNYPRDITDDIRDLRAARSQPQTAGQSRVSFAQASAGLIMPNRDEPDTPDSGGHYYSKDDAPHYKSATGEDIALTPTPPADPYVPAAARSRTGSTLEFLGSGSPGTWAQIDPAYWPPVEITVGASGLLQVGMHCRLSPPGTGIIQLSFDLDPRPTGLTWEYEDYQLYQYNSEYGYPSVTSLFTGVPQGQVTVMPLHAQSGGDIRNGTLWAIAF